MIEVQNYHKSYRETLAVSGLSFTVRPGEILGLVGPNGAGKTTTLRAIAGVIPPTLGTLSVAGFNVVENPITAKQQMAYVPDDPRLFETLTVWEHLEFIASAYRVEEISDKGAELLRQFELDERRDTVAQELSRGMRQKAAIVCAYLHDPRAILFDEPLTGLDPKAIRTLKESIRERAAAGAAIIISSHLLSLVEDLCSHLLILVRGKSRYFGRMEDVRSQFPGAAADASLEELFFHATELAEADDLAELEGEAAE